MSTQDLKTAKKVLFLYAEVMGYTIATIRELVREGCEVHVVYWDSRRLTPYEPPKMDGVCFYPRTKFSSKSLRGFVSQLDPDITFVSGWQDKGYLPAAASLRKNGGIVVSGFDSQWHRNHRYTIASLLGSLGFFKIFFSHAWVPGMRQYEFAKKLGFLDFEIIFDLYSADTELFQRSNVILSNKKTPNYPHVFLFVGRFEPVKGLQDLVHAWRAISEDRGDWELWLVGSGSLKGWLLKQGDIKVLDFFQPTELAKIIPKVGCFVLPSRSEPWGVVVHEFAGSGLPLILSDAVGAASEFLIPGHNGYVFPRSNPKALSHSMNQIIKMSDDELRSFGAASEALSRRITSQTSAANFLSLFASSRSSQ